MVDETFGALVYIVDNPAGALNCRLADDIQAHAGRVYVVGNGALCSQENARQFLIPNDASIFQPVLEVIPSQILAYKLAESQGFEPGSVRFISKVITTETGIPSEQI
ncbi:MAG: hypothetical protein MUO62_05075 [Anaerolineales bacterium]|nr:hypothetical protein [Anaerolineales bacterium]